jgi:transcriptional regulator GlxA family with amidase domain
MRPDDISPPTHKRPKLVVMVAFDGASSLDIVGPLDVLSGSIVANQSDIPDYSVEITSRKGELISTTPAGISIATKPFEAFENREIDTLMIAGGESIDLAVADAQLIDWIAKTAIRARRVASVCTGAFLLAETGLLSGRRATTHWRWAKQFQEQYPAVQVEEDKIYVKDGKFFSSAGIAAGMDLALGLIEDDLGPQTALAVAQNWVMFLKRPGGQSQFSSLLPPSTQAQGPIADLLPWLQDNLNTDLSVEKLAGKCGMSDRNFARKFVSEVGVTPSKFVESIRLQAAKSYLETTPTAIEVIAAQTGFVSADRMRRSFLRNLKVNPQDYRERFRFRQ